MTTTTASRLLHRPRTPATTHDISPIPFRRLLGVEWRKSIDTRSARWLLAAAATMTVAAVAIPLAMPSEADQTIKGYLSFAALGLCILLPAVSNLTLTTEWSQRTVLATFTQEPRRIRVLAAKVVSGLLLGLVGALFTGLVAVAGLAASAGLGRTVTWHVTASGVASVVAFVLLNSVMGMAFGVALLKTPAAVVLFYALPAVWAVISIGALQTAREWLDTVKTFGWVLDADWTGHLAQILVSTAVWVLMPFAVGVVRTLRHEIA